MSTDNKYVVLILFQYSVIVKGFEKKLRELDYKVEVVSEQYEKIRGSAGNAGVYIFYLPPDIADDKIKLDQLKKMIDIMQQDKHKALMIGEAKFHNLLIDHIPVIDDYPWFDRPVADMQEFAASIQKILSSPSGVYGKKRILIVDDDPSYAGMVREWTKSTYHVDVVTAGMQAITFLLKNHVDLILLDYEMPVVDGPQVFQMLKQEEKTKDIPVVFLTGNGTMEAVSRVMGLKPDGYILKSTTRNNLLKYLNDKLG